MLKVENASAKTVEPSKCYELGHELGVIKTRERHVKPSGFSFIGPTYLNSQ